MYRRAEGMGIEMEQEWMAAIDSRTRDSHRRLDGQRVAVGESWESDHGPIRCPGDPEAHPAEVWNCRCTVRAVIKGFDYDDSARFSRLPEGMTYEEWKLGKKTQGAVAGKAEYDRLLAEGAFSKRVNPQKQSRHIVGSKEWNQRVEKLAEGEMLPSSLSIDAKEAQRLVDELGGNGTIYVKHKRNGDVQVKETCKTADGSIIGTWRDSRTGQVAETDRFTIHYSKTATHIVPATP